MKQEFKKNLSSLEKNLNSAFKKEKHVKRLKELATYRQFTDDRIMNAIKY